MLEGLLGSELALLWVNFGDNLTNIRIQMLEMLGYFCSRLAWFWVNNDQIMTKIYFQMLEDVHVSIVG